jgi:two-component system, response regulator PdtaR
MGDFRILIVEDEAILAMNEQKILSKLGYVVCGMTDNGRAAIEIAKRVEPDLILMDIRIRGPIDGIQTAECIRRFSDVPILYTTAYSDEDTMSRSRKTAHSHHLFKPWQPCDLQEAIETCLSRSGREDSEYTRPAFAQKDAVQDHHRNRCCAVKEG